MDMQNKRQSAIAHGCDVWITSENHRWYIKIRHRIGDLQIPLNEEETLYAMQLFDTIQTANTTCDTFPLLTTRDIHADAVERRAEQERDAEWAKIYERDDDEACALGLDN